MKLSRFVAALAVATTIALSSAGMALANPSAGIPDTSGFVGLKAIQPECGPTANTFAVVGQYVGYQEATLRLQRLVNIENGVYQWINAGDYDGLSVLLNGREVSGEDLQPGAPQLTVEYGDIFQLSHSHEADGSTYIYRLLVAIGDQEEQLRIDRLSVEFPGPESCSDVTLLGYAGV
ncbi:hypothetical protein HY312_00175 [Candidatus Saccharibacteria bacterium]|nr:hypothetical protein [Candidatus Saccharibacteria bacterium]